VTGPEPSAAPPPPADAEVPVDEVVDASGLACPMPVIELAKAVERVPAGGRVLLLATDPAARVDVPVWCRMQRHRLREHDQDDTGVDRFLVERTH
jgi:tRNA 2-thiouridine synthesizing protein A